MHRLTYWISIFLLMLIVSTFGSLSAEENRPTDETEDESQVAAMPQSATQYQDVIRPVLVKYCVDCHDPDDDEDPVGFLKIMTADGVAESRAIWSSVAEQLNNRTMPPGDSPQPSESERLTTASWIEDHLYQTACSDVVYAGSPVPRRLNRDQYEYVIEDLTGLEFDFIQTFPSDGGGGEGFNNNGEMLYLPPLLLERYLEVAAEITDRILVVPRFNRRYVMPEASNEQIDTEIDTEQTSKKQAIHLIESTDSNQQTQQGWIDPGRRASLSLVVYQEGNYRITTRLQRSGDESANAIVRLDSKKIRPLRLTGDSNVSQMTEEVRLSKGAHVITWDIEKESAPLRLLSVSVEQQRDDVSSDRLQATERLIGPGKQWVNSDPRRAASEIIKSFARRAWRRPILTEEVDRSLTLFDRGIERGEPFEQAIKLPLQSVLVSPNFLFQIEQGRTGSSPQRISDIELASRLSFFLWHSIPDDELLDLAIEGQLHHPKVLDAQIDRMLADPKSLRFAQAFAGQWLGTEAVGRTKIPDTNFFKPAYSSDLVLDLRRQVGETMHYMLREDRSILDWIDADYAIVNKRLAKHYKIKPVPKSNDRFEPVPLQDSPRTGIVGLGAVHMLTSYSRRTSPVLRGGWVLETIFGVHLPTPPPDVGDLPGGKHESKKKTVRQRLEEHRANPTCAACHDLIDPIGFAMENFDVLGRWREKEGEHPIDAKGQLPSGESFDGPLELRQVLVNRQDDFREQLSRKMLGYALGRSLIDADACTINRVAEETKRHDDKIVAMIKAVVSSHPFQFREGFSE